MLIESRFGKLGMAAAMVLLVVFAILGCDMLNPLQEAADQTPGKPSDLVAQIMQASGREWKYDADHDQWYTVSPEPLFSTSLSRELKQLNASLRGNGNAQQVKKEKEEVEGEAVGCPEDPDGDPNGSYEVWQAAFFAFPYHDDWNKVQATAIVYKDAGHTYYMNYASCRDDLQQVLGWPKTQLHMQNLGAYYKVTSGGSGVGFAETIAANGKDSTGWALIVQLFHPGLNLWYEWIANRVCNSSTQPFNIAHTVQFRDKTVWFTTYPRTTVRGQITCIPDQTIYALGEIDPTGWNNVFVKDDIDYNTEGFNLWAEWEDNECPSGSPYAWKSDYYGSLGKKARFKTISAKERGGTTHSYSSSDTITVNSNRQAPSPNCLWTSPTVGWINSNTMQISW